MNRDHAARSYADLAPYYDRFTSGHRHDDWAGALERAATAHGLRGQRLLDIACGTGNSLLPFLARGYHVTGCDLTPEMLALAAEKCGDGVGLFQADVRELPPAGPFDLALCAGDVLNYLLEPGDLERAFSSIRRVLAPGGLAVFDVNTLGSYRSVFATDRWLEDEAAVTAWRGLARADQTEGSLIESRVEIFTRAGAGWRRETSVHTHRHHPDAAIRGALATGGLKCVAVYGVTPDGQLHDVVKELEQTKRLYVAAASASATTRKGGSDAPDREARDAGDPGRGLHEGRVAAWTPLGAVAPSGGLALGDRHHL
jgi:ubiquinone/menaquinone biosynthesis C-methylase UbiE